MLNLNYGFTELVKAMSRVVNPFQKQIEKR